MRAARLVSALLLLQTRGRLTAQQLADELEVSVRTVYRDMESLSAAGVPVYSDRGPDGGYQLVDGYRTQLTGLTAEEADTLFLGGLPGPAAELGLGTVVAAAQLKVLAALPPELRSRASRVQERFHLDAAGWFRHDEPVPALPTVAAAVWDQERLTIRYRSWKAEVTRTVEPLGLVLKAQRWYLLAQVDGQQRTYRVSRLREVASTGEHFERPEGFDLPSAWRAWSDRFEARMFRDEAQVRLSPTGQKLVSMLLEANQARAARDTAGPPDDDGWVAATIPIESVRHGVHAMLQLGTDVEVLGPPELRRAVGDAAATIAARYA